MPIKFSLLLQDTFNFIRNRANFTLYAVLTLTGLQMAITGLFPRSQLDLQAVQTSPELAQQAMLSTLFPSILSLLAVVFVNVLLILNIKSINNGQYRHFFQHIGESAQRFLPVTLLSILQFLPISIGFSFLLMLGAEGGLLALPLLISGLFVFIKLNLVIYTYLLEQPKIGSALKFTWTMSRGKMLPLIIFCALIYGVPMLLSGVVNGVQLALGEILGNLIGQLLGALINLLVTIFSFRFYQTYRQYKGA